MPYMRTVKTTSGTTAVQVVWSSRVTEIEHLGSAHEEAELETLKAAAQERITARQLELGRLGPASIVRTQPTFSHRNAAPMSSRCPCRLHGQQKNS